MTPDQWVDLVKWSVAVCGTLAAAYAAWVKYLDTIRYRPISEPSSKVFAQTVEKDSTARREYMEALTKNTDSMARNADMTAKILDKLVALQLSHSEGSIKSNTITESLHKMTRDRIDQMANAVSRDLVDIKENQITINGTIRDSMATLSETIKGSR